VRRSRPYDQIGENLGIAPPAQGEVEGTVQRIDSKEQLEALLGATP
jgi:hypothetical protein